GVLWFFRANHWHGSPWHFVADGEDTVVSESSTADPDRPVQNSTFLPAALFPDPLAKTWSDTRGADVSWIPIPFANAFELRYERPFYATGYFIASVFAEGATNLSRAPCTWSHEPPPDDVRTLFRMTAEDIAPSLGTSRLAGVVDVGPNGST